MLKQELIPLVGTATPPISVNVFCMGAARVCTLVKIRKGRALYTCLLYFGMFTGVSQKNRI